MVCELPAARWYEPSAGAPELGWRKTGVIGGEPGRAQSPPAKTSVKTSSSQPSFTAGNPDMIERLKNTWLVGVGTMPLVGGELSVVLKLPEAESVGVAGK